MADRIGETSAKTCGNYRTIHDFEELITFPFNQMRRVTGLYLS